MREEEGASVKTMKHELWSVRYEARLREGSMEQGKEALLEGAWSWKVLKSWVGQA